MRVFLPLILTAVAADAWRISFYLGSGCMGEELDAVSYPDGSACDTIPRETINVQSVLVSKDSPDDDDYEVSLWGSKDCTGESLGVISDGPTCFPDRRENLKAYRIHKIQKKRELERTRSPGEVTRDVNAWMERQSTGLAVRSQETDLDLAPAKTHPELNALIVASPDVNYFHTFVSVSTSLVAGALSFTSLVSGCIGVGSASSIGELSCITSLLATVISFMATVYHGYKGLKDFGAHLTNNGIELGFRRPGARRSIDDTMLLSHEEYMGYMLDKAGLNGTHIGYHDRESSNFTSPAFHFHGEDGQQFVYTISPTVDGEVRHTFSFHHDTQIQKRQGYQGVTVAGGLDVEGCQRKSATYSDLPTSASSAYSYYSQDVRCLISGSGWRSNNYAQADIFDKSGNSALTLGISTYRGSQANEVGDKAACSNADFHFDENCVY